VPCQHAAPLFKKAVAYGAYDGALRDLLHLFKYQHVRSAVPLLGRLLNLGLAGTELPGNVLVVPVPLFRAKQRSRGFNQAEDIARNFVRCQTGDGIQVETAALVRTRETASQTGLTRHQRRSNLRGAFAVPQPEKVRGRNILIVDDVMTTGTTAGECTRVLLRAGASQVFVATVARAIKGVESLLANAASDRSTSDHSSSDHSRGTLGHA
jgi:ComF family protein